MLVVMENVDIGYSKPILRNINVTMDKNGLVLVIGANGSGKTSFLKTIAGLLKPLKGTVKVLGKKPYSPFFDRSIIGYVAQDPLHQLTEPRVIDEVLLQARSTSEANYWLKRLGLSKLAYEKTLNLSIGEMKKVLIASALARNPRILLIDEPSLGQDTSSLKQVISILREYSNNNLVVIATHDIRILSCLKPYMVIEVDGGVVKVRRVS